MRWYKERPLVIGDNLYVVAVDSPYMLCINRRNGSVNWTHAKGTAGPLLNGQNAPEAGAGGATYLLGAARTGELVIAYSGVRTHAPAALHMLDPASGKVVWESGPIIAEENQPILKYRHGDINSPTGPAFCLDINNWNWQAAVRPFMSDDGKVCFGSYIYLPYP